MVVVTGHACCTHNCDCMIASLTYSVMTASVSSMLEMMVGVMYVPGGGVGLYSHHDLSLVGLEHLL